MKGPVQRKLCFWGRRERRDKDAQDPLIGHTKLIITFLSWSCPPVSHGPAHLFHLALPTCFTWPCPPVSPGHAHLFHLAHNNLRRFSLLPYTVITWAIIATVLITDSFLAEFELAENIETQFPAAAHSISDAEQTGWIVYRMHNRCMQSIYFINDMSLLKTNSIKCANYHMFLSL